MIIYDTEDILNEKKIYIFPFVYFFEERFFFRTIYDFKSKVSFWINSLWFIPYCNDVDLACKNAVKKKKE